MRQPFPTPQDTLRDFYRRELITRFTARDWEAALTIAEVVLDMSSEDPVVRAMADSCRQRLSGSPDEHPPASAEINRLLREPSLAQPAATTADTARFGAT